jgi:CheY-like chemotaxis protein
VATVLLVDDHSSLLASIGLRLAAEGHIVWTATNGLDSLRLARESRPDVLITDCAMPVIRGSALCSARLSRVPQWR